MPLNPAQERSKLRATQSLVSHMGFVWSHPSLTAIEIAWRWIVGVPFLAVAWTQAQRILAQIPPDSAGLDRLDWQNPWLSSVLLADAISRYEPSVASVLRWLLPVAVVVWAIVSGFGRALLLTRMNTLDPIGKPNQANPIQRLLGFIGLQALWMIALLACLGAWYRAVGWACATYITIGSQPDLLPYLCWLIFLSLGIFVLWALLSWTLAVAPLMLLLEGDGGPGASIRALLRSFSLGKTLSGKLMEVSLVLAIVKIMLMSRFSSRFSSAMISFTLCGCEAFANCGDTIVRPASSPDRTSSKRGPLVSRAFALPH